jgi:KDO2-lipid IV(A) lauroyltransferase
MFSFLLRPFAYLPLWLLHAIGTGLGWLIYWGSPRYRHTLNDNIRQSGLCQNEADYTRLIRISIAQHGKAGMELPYAWCRTFPHLAKLVRQTSGMLYVEQAIADKSPVIFVLPHLGSFDICGMYLSTCLPFPTTAMYRPPKISGLEPLMKAGRNRYQGNSAPTNVAGIRVLMKALKNNEAIIILPDQAPGEGDGVWAPFFGRPAYTMTLLPRLAKSANATILMCFAERLAGGQGFHIHIMPMDQAFASNKIENATILNRNIEKLINLAPEQYLWSYNRYKRPRGAPPIPGEA